MRNISLRPNDATSALSLCCFSRITRVNFGFLVGCLTINDGIADSYESACCHKVLSQPQLYQRVGERIFVALELSAYDAARSGRLTRKIILDRIDRIDPS